MGLLDSLGLDKVEADPNALPDGKYAGEVFKDEHILHKGKGSTEKDTISHVITYRVTEGDRAGAQRQEWFALVKDPVRDPETQEIVGGTPVMTEQQKPWYKKRLTDLGVPEDKVNEHKPGDLTGTQVTFGVKKNGNFININFVELREAPENPTGSATVGAL